MKPEGLEDFGGKDDISNFGDQLEGHAEKWLDDEELLQSYKLGKLNDIVMGSVYTDYRLMIYEDWGFDLEELLSQARFMTALHTLPDDFLERLHNRWAEVNNKQCYG